MVKMTEVNKELTVAKLLAGMPSERRKEIAKIVSIFRKYSKDVKVWGDSIIGAGKLWYQTKSQKPYWWFQCGVASRASSISVYLGVSQLAKSDVAKIGPKCKFGVGCLYLKSLEDVDLKQLELAIKKAFSIKEVKAPGSESKKVMKAALKRPSK